jgi:DNA topoisomerase-2
MTDTENSESDWNMDSPSPAKVVLGKGKVKKTAGDAAKEPLKESTNKAAARDNRPVEEVYQKKTQLEHILLRPDTYIGSTEPITQPMWVFDELSEKLIERNITYVPGLYKIFDEILVNAADNKQRDASMSRIKVTIDKESGTISVENNGQGIPVVLHSEHKVYIPEMIFGQLLTSSNYDDSKEKVTGGRNGYGAKLANIFSDKFIVETVDSKEGLKFVMEWSENMGKKSSPKITKSSGADYTRVTFTPDFSRFNMTSLDNDTVALMSKRVYDIAGCSHSSVKVFLNDKQIPVKNFKDYVELYVGHDSEGMKLYVTPHERWEIIIGMSDGQFKQVN